MADENVQNASGGEEKVDPVSSDAYRAAKAEEGSEGATQPRMIPVRDREFRVADQLPGIVLLDLGLASDPNATQGEQLRALRQFLHAAIHEDDVEAFEVFLRTARPVIEMEELNKVVEKLVEMTAGNPTEP
jgi:hypothetical protein